MELLPSQAYGNGWLKVAQNGETLKALPQQNDPYEEIYKLRDKWYGLLREDWINPANHRRAGFGLTSELLDKAKKFHRDIANTYHDQSYGHYGVDPSRAAWHNVVWKIGTACALVNPEKLKVASDNFQGKLKLIELAETDRNGQAPQFLEVQMQAACDPGDQTVPLHSAEHQLQSGKFKGIFRQCGYEHQDSYKDEAALHSTLYSLVRIAQTMTWTTK